MHDYVDWQQQISTPSATGQSWPVLKRRGALTALGIIKTSGSWYQGLACELALGRVAAFQRRQRRVEWMHGMAQSLHQAVAQAIRAHLWKA